MNTKPRPANKGSFKKGKDKRRNRHGQTRAAAVSMGALLKQYITHEGSRSAGPGKGSKAERLAVVIWERALLGDFQYVNFLADRLMGKLKESSTVEDQAGVEIQLGLIAERMMMPGRN